MPQATFTMDELKTLVAAGFTAEFICRDLHAMPKSVARRLRRHGLNAEAKKFDEYDRILNGSSVSA